MRCERVFAQRATICIKAMLSGPPDTARARGNVKSCRSRFRSCAPMGSPAVMASAARALTLALSPVLHVSRRIRKPRAELGIGRARRILLPKAIERHCELQETFGSLRAPAVGLIPLEEGGRSGLVLGTDE